MDSKQIKLRSSLRVRYNTVDCMLSCYNDRMCFLRSCPRTPHSPQAFHKLAINSYLVKLPQDVCGRISHPWIHLAVYDPFRFRWGQKAGLLVFVPRTSSTFYNSIANRIQNKPDTKFPGQVIPIYTELRQKKSGRNFFYYFVAIVEKCRRMNHKFLSICFLFFYLFSRRKSYFTGISL